MTIRVPSDASLVEREVIATIRSIRSLETHELHQILSDDPARLMHYFILSTHGHVKFRLTPIANELAVEMRTLQRDFVEAFKKTMHQCQIDARLSHSKTMLRAIPLTKISVIAATLGYNTASDFVRFFEKREHRTPSEWGRVERERVQQEEQITAQRRNQEKTST